jgi:hypothetical protein
LIESDHAVMKRQKIRASLLPSGRLLSVCFFVAVPGVTRSVFVVFDSSICFDFSITHVLVASYLHSPHHYNTLTMISECACRCHTFCFRCSTLQLQPSVLTVASYSRPPHHYNTLSMISECACRCHTFCFRCSTHQLQPSVLIVASYSRPSYRYNTLTMISECGCRL